jgi:NTP pyrophosphatase (non-canonical NTP hydrolase)
LKKCTFNTAKKLVRQLVNTKGFPNDKAALNQKLLWAFVELGEAADAYKKGEDWNKVCEELVDVIFYILDFIGLVEKTQRINIDVDSLFLQKWNRNMQRPNHYGQERDITKN